MSSRHITALQLIVLAQFAASSSLLAEIKHTFVAVDESRNQLLYVDEFDPSNDWTVPLKGNRDLQIISETRILVSIPGGYREYEIKTGKVIKEVLFGADICSVVRTENGHTLLANNSSIWELDSKDQLVNTHITNAGPFFRLLRLGVQGNFLFTNGVTSLKELTPAGDTVHKIDLKKMESASSKPYFMMQSKNGEYLVSTGYGASILFFDKDYELTRTINTQTSGATTHYHFFAGAEILANGHLVVANWTGHHSEDSKKGPQVIEFDKKGRQVWTWQDAKRAGSLHGVAFIK